MTDRITYHRFRTPGVLLNKRKYKSGHNKNGRNQTSIIPAGIQRLCYERQCARHGNRCGNLVIGAAFGKIVSSLVADIITPLMGLLCGGVDFKRLGITLVEKTADKDAVVLTYGVFLQTIFDFVIIAFAIFLSMKLINRLKRSIVKEEKAEEAQEEVAEPSEDVKLLTEIRDLLKQQNSGK